MSKFLEQINSPADLKRLTYDELKVYAEEVRHFIIDSVKNTGGHLASNLGTVELTIALHYVFDSPTDKIIWDVGHQSYTHKIITGRLSKFSHLRENGGISGFPKMTESEHDAFTVGHSSTSLSAGVGLARAAELTGEKRSVVSVIGDGAFTGGMAFEALNDIGERHTKMIMILNDNTMSISKNVGALSKYLSRLRLSKRYYRFKHNIKLGVQTLPFFGDRVYKFLDKTKEVFKSIFQSNKMFESLGVKYYGPLDGHNIALLIQVLKQLKSEQCPVILHLITDKGKGSIEAQHNPCKFHGVSPLDATKENCFSQVFSEFMCDSAKTDKNLVAITAAMADGTGLVEFSKMYPDRFFDVGIAEEHAVTMAAGMASGGIKPYFAVYSTFLQRGFDQILHDVCINNLPVTFAVDRSGAVGADGVTHQGIYDISYLSMIPNMTICTPKDGDEFKKMLQWSISFNAPLAIRYPKSFVSNYNTNNSIVLGKWENLRASKGSNVYILAAGNRALDAAIKIEDANIINALFIKPLDIDFLDAINKPGNLIITVEDNAIAGGFGEAVLRYIYSCESGAKVEIVGYPDKFEEGRSSKQSLIDAGIHEENFKKIIKSFKESLKKLV